MANRNLFENLLMSMSILALGLLMAGTKACQEDYDFDMTITRFSM